MSLTQALAEDINAYLVEHGVEVPVLTGALSDAPPKQVAVVSAEGRGTTLNGAFDRPAFDVLCRAEYDDDADELARRVDSYFMRFEVGDLDGRYVMWMNRSSGSPGLRTTTAEGWAQYGCLYTMEIENEEVA